MRFRYTLPAKWIDKVSRMEEFANGGMQVSVCLSDGRVFHGILISNSMHPVAMRGFKDLPFSLEDISDIYQTDEDRNPQQRNDWAYWDNWRT